MLDKQSYGSGGKDGHHLPSHPLQSIGNLLMWFMCVAAFALSAYTHLQQGHIETRLRHIANLDERLAVVEQMMDGRLPLPPAFANAPPGTWGTFDSTSSTSDDFPGDVLQKITLNLAGMQRMRRDVSHLQLTRHERQASIQQSPDCVCQPGMFA